MFAPLPNPPIFPVASSSTQLARTLAVPTVCCVWPMHQIRVAGNSGNPLHLIRRPVLDFLADLVHPEDALLDEFLVFPAILEDMPQHAPDRGDVGPGADADVLSRVRGRSRHPRIDDDKVRSVEL